MWLLSCDAPSGQAACVSPSRPRCGKAGQALSSYPHLELVRPGQARALLRVQSERKASGLPFVHQQVRRTGSSRVAACARLCSRAGEMRIKSR